ncbi:MAG: dTDP-4-dehydrorhamnose reductase [Ignavibacteriales bacterium]|nr:dTDP-4-dehydrorhamnose reductase [Ignavibacteriales bacterium]MCF8438203.1 dTDP-4-dehydrorhamnose reductase [Ignavibacteriales bacterium]
MSAVKIKKRVLIVGSNGQLGGNLARYYSNKVDQYEVMCSSVEERSLIDNVPYKQVDIKEKNSVKDLFYSFYPDVVLNTAAFTNVDAAESNRNAAWDLNVKAVENLIKYCGPVSARLIHFSTDYVFDGKNGPYSEDDRPSPINYYGRTKLASENLLFSSDIKYTLIRTNILYGNTGSGKVDFVTWVVKQIRAGNKINIVDDQIGNPTYVKELVSALADIVERDIDGIYHIAGAEWLSRYDFTLRIARYFNLPEISILRIKTPSLKQAAERPLVAGLKIEKAMTELSYSPQKFEISFSKIAAEENL